MKTARTNSKKPRSLTALLVIAAGTVFFSLLPAALVQARSAPEPVCQALSLEKAVTIAMHNNPGLAAIQARYEAMSAVPSQRGSLPDPVLGLAVLNLPTDTLSLDQENMTQIQVGLTQRLPFPGKLELREKTADLEAEAVGQQVKEARLRLQSNVKIVWWDVFYLQQALDIVRSNQELLRSTVASTRTKYEVGKGLQQDVLLAQLELSKLMDREMALVNRLNKKKADLRALLELPASARCFALPRPARTKLPVLSPERALQARAVRFRPILQSLQKQRDAARERIKLADKDYYPDFTAGAAYGFRQDMPDGRRRADFVSFKLSMNLPVWSNSKQDKAVAQKTSEALSLSHKLRAMEDRVQAEVSRELSEYDSARQQSRFYENSIIPQAEQTATAMLKGYQVNKVDFLNVVRAQLALYNYKITYWRMLSRGFKALAALEAATGGPVAGAGEKKNEK
ncbi:Heavy metal RND efflux outer membrane protein, CzcC family [hydrothermal vent metagenome]|uniref:Heavy metal RND efflux outer membrane protein, CzcC family n=1 Tax=hydrothermal vent metagenome TaxID=652676 RepID=A0A3B0V5F5_9ZZZZ